MDTIEVFKWIGIGVAAGFVGYFGKHAAKVIIAKLSKKKEKKTAPEQKTVSDKEAKYKYKLEKKRLKAEKKS